MDKIKILALELARRLKQPTSMAGLSALFLMLGMAPGTISVVAQAIVAVAGVFAIVLDDGSNAPVQAPVEGAVETSAAGTSAAGGLLDRLGTLLGFGRKAAS